MEMYYFDGTGNMKKFNIDDTSSFLMDWNEFIENYKNLFVNNNINTNSNYNGLREISEYDMLCHISNNKKITYNKENDFLVYRKNQYVNKEKFIKFVDLCISEFEKTEDYLECKTLMDLKKFINSLEKGEKENTNTIYKVDLT